MPQFSRTKLGERHGRTKVFGNLLVELGEFRHGFDRMDCDTCDDRSWWVGESGNKRLSGGAVTFSLHKPG